MGWPNGGRGGRRLTTQVEATPHAHVLAVGRNGVRLRVAAYDLPSEPAAMRVLVQAVCKSRHVREAFEQAQLRATEAL